MMLGPHTLQMLTLPQRLHIKANKRGLAKEEDQ